jgi:hypothetical protein
MNLIDLARLPLRYKPWRPRHPPGVADSVRRCPAARQPEHDHRVHLRHHRLAVPRPGRARRPAPMPAASPPAGASRTAGCRAIPKPRATSSKPCSPPRASRPSRTIARATHDRLGALAAGCPTAPFPATSASRQPSGDLQPGPDHARPGGRLHPLGRQDCLEAGVRAGHWLADQQDDDGCFRRFEHNDTPHVYNTRATWAAGRRPDGRRAAPGGRRAPQSRLGADQQTAAAGFATNAFVPGRSPFTHTIAYAIRGFSRSACCSASRATSTPRCGRARHRRRAARRRLAGRHLP